MKRLDLSSSYCLSAPVISKRFVCKYAFDLNVATKWATNRGVGSWIEVYFAKEMNVAQVSVVDMDRIGMSVMIK